MINGTMNEHEPATAQTASKSLEFLIVRGKYATLSEIDVPIAC